MRIRKDTSMYVVAPLNKSEREEIITKLREKFPAPCGIPTFYVCRAIGDSWKDKERHLCYAREDRYKPCTTLCHVCIKILNGLLTK